MQLWHATNVPIFCALFLSSKYFLGALFDSKADADATSGDSTVGQQSPVPTPGEIEGIEFNLPASYYFLCSTEMCVLSLKFL